jgi:hypothetical protein
MRKGLPCSALRDLSLGRPVCRRASAVFSPDSYQKNETLGAFGRCLLCAIAAVNFAAEVLVSSVWSQWSGSHMQ